MSSFLVACVSLFASVGLPPVLVEGSTAPDFQVSDIVGNTLTLDALVKQGPVVLAFFPKANTSGCTEELKTLTAQYDAMVLAHATVIAVSGDSADTLADFQKSLGAKLHFVADDKGLLMKAYNTKMPILNVSRRRTLLIGQDKTIRLLLKDGDAVANAGLLDKLKTLGL